MEETYNYIEAYFTQTLSESERKVFEQRCIDDEAFANDVAFYAASRQAIRQQLLQQKQEQWAETTSAEQIQHIKPVSRSLVRRMMPYAAAACVILFVAVYFITQNSSPGSLARGFADKNFSHINNVLGPSDTMQQAVEVFNNKDYAAAKKMFELLQKKYPGDADEKKYLGLSYLFTQDYDKALHEFDSLAKMQLQSNPGNFLKAITLMERGSRSDLEQAKQLLQQEADSNTEWSGQAKDWLKKM